MGKSAARVMICWALALSLSHSIARGQTTFGSLSGSVLDPAGAVVPRAQVILTNLGTNAKQATTTNAAGIYEFVNVVPGNYRLDAEKSGFKRLSRSPVVVEVQQSYRIDLTMQLGEVTQEVSVTSAPPLLQPQTSSLGQVIAGRSVGEMPLNGRNVFNLMALVPSVVPQGQSSGTPVGQNPFAWNNYQVSGVLAGQSAEMLDGVPMNSSYVNLPVFIPTQDSIQEFKVETNNLGPEWGRYAGGVMNLVTKSGTNLVHGEAYEYLRNKVLNANDFFSNEAGIPVGAFTQNQFGANAGGPVYIPGVYDGRSKTFWFFSYEGFWLRQGESITDTVPTAAERTGDFSNLRDTSGNVVPIYNPLTVCGEFGNPACAVGANGQAIYTRQQFPGNAIPGPMINPTSAKLENLWPMPTTPGQTYTNVNNWIGLAAVGGDSDQVVSRIDHNISDKQRAYARFSYSYMLNQPTDPFRNGVCLDRCTEKYGARSIAADDTYSFSPTVLLDIHVGYNRFAYDRIPVSSGFDVTSVGWPAALNSVADPRFRTFPAPVVEVMSPDIFGSQGASDTIIGRTNDWFISGDLTKLRGRHTLKFGGNFYVQQMNLGDIRLATGQFSFDHGFTQEGPFTPAGGYGFASYLLGYPSSGAQQESGLTAGQEIYRAVYGGDTWQAAKKLTFNLGLRYEQDGPWTERYNHLAVWDLRAASPLAQLTGLPLKGTTCLVDSSCRPSRSDLNLDPRQFAPRLGFAYLLNKDSVIRGGYGISWIRNDFSVYTQPWDSPLVRGTTPFVGTINGGITPLNVAQGWSNPFPDGVLQPPGRSSDVNQFFLDAGGATIAAPPVSYGYVQQWNFDVQHQFKGVVVDMAYAGTKGTHLSSYQSADFLADKYLSLGNALFNQVPNPFFGLIQSGPLSSSTISAEQLLLPYPQYTGVGLGDSGFGDSIYHSFQLKVQKQFRGGGMLLAAYTVSKLLSDVDEQNSWLEGSTGGVAGVIDWNNIKGSSYSLASQDVPQRLVVSYVMNLPVGHGQKYLTGLSGAPGKLISGWGVDGISTFQSGFPLKIGSSGGGTMPNRTCRNASLQGSVESRLNEWFNTSCFSLSAPFTYGTESRVDPTLRQQGINNFDFALFKNTNFGPGERYGIQFRAEVFNLFNTPEFGSPATTVGVSSFGVVGSQVNNPRLIQFGLKFLF